jgi:hypothetical protein
MALSLNILANDFLNNYSAIVMAGSWKLEDRSKSLQLLRSSSFSLPIFLVETYFLLNNVLSITDISQITPKYHAT